MATDFSTLDAVYPLPPEELYRQWVLTRDHGIAPQEWDHHSLNGWHLGAHPDANVCALRAADGSSIGWVIEPLVYLTGDGGTAPTDHLTLPVNENASSAEIERALYGRNRCGRSNCNGLVGPWTAIVFAGPGGTRFRRVYLGATHSVVFSVQSGTVGTTQNLIPDVQRDEELSRTFDPLARNTYYSFGLTPFRGVCRLLPNHYLDLDTFEAVRHWPLAGFDPVADGREGAAAIVDHSRQLLEVLSTRYDRFKVLLSAGRDSRAVLSLLAPFVDEGEFDVLLSTTVGRDLGSRVDLQAARHLARISGLPHEVKHRQRRKGTEIDRMYAFARIGEAKAGSILLAPGLKERKPEKSRFGLAGMAGEVGRAFYWSDGHPSTAEVTPAFLAARTSSPKIDAVIEAVEAWLDGLPPGIRDSTPDTLDLAYVEQRLGCWAAPTKYLFPGRRHACSPMAASFNIQTMLCLPEAYRAAGVLQRDMVAYGWPELLEVPFNKPTGLLRLSGWARHFSRPINRARVYLGALRNQLLDAID